MLLPRAPAAWLLMSPPAPPQASCWRTQAAPPALRPAAQSHWWHCRPRARRAAAEAARQRRRGTARRRRRAARRTRQRQARLPGHSLVSAEGTMSRFQRRLTMQAPQPPAQTPPWRAAAVPRAAVCRPGRQRATRASRERSQHRTGCTSRLMCRRRSPERMADTCRPEAPAPVRRWPPAMRRRLAPWPAMSCQ